MAIPDGLQQHEVERLSLIRYQMLIARQQSNQPAPLNSLALNMMQDAVESMLSLAAEHEHVAVPNRADFLQLFDAVSKAVSAEEPLSGFRPGAAAMNQARVNFKHHGNQAESNTIDRHVSNSIGLVNALSEAVFGIEIDSVSLLLFVRHDDTRNHLELTQERWNTGDSEGAMDELKLAFDSLVRDYEQRKAWHPGKSLFSTKPSFIPSGFDIRDHGKEMEKAFEWLESLDGWVKMLALGVDMRRYAYFDAHTPSAIYTMDGNVNLYRRDGIAVTEIVFTRCFRFVVDTALSFAEDDFDFDAWSARHATEE